jgi:hypothetical protein
MNAPQASGAGTREKSARPGRADSAGILTARLCSMQEKATNSLCYRFKRELSLQD